MAHVNFREYFTTSRLHDVWIVTLLCGAIFAVYFPAMHGSFLWDDDAHVTGAHLRSLHGLWRIWFELGATQQYYPLLHSAFWLEHKLWGDAVVGYHLMNLLLHVFAVCLLLTILRRLKIPGAFLAAAIFALHPVHVESVAWITEQKNTLSAVFYLSAMLVYLRFDQERRTPLYVLALGLFVLGLLTKTVTATLPGALLVIFWWQRGRVSWKQDVIPLIPWFVVGAAAGLLTAWVERKLFGAEGAAFDLTLLQRCLLAGRVIWFYVGKLFWPADLMFIYPRWKLDPPIWWQYLFPLGAIALVGTLWLMRRRWRGPIAGLLFFIGSLFPALGFFNVFPFVYSFVADHFQYLASLGIIVVVAAAITVALDRMPPRLRRASQALCVAMVAVLAVLTWKQSGMYRDPQVLYETTLDKNPDCWMCRNNLGILLAQAGKLWEAIGQYEAALRINPNNAFAHNNLGNALAGEGLLSAAMGHYQQALRLNPDYADAHYNFGNALVLEERLPAAINHYEQALRLKPNDANTHNGLGIALLLMGRLSEAKEQWEATLRISPDHAMARHNLLALQQQKTAPNRNSVILKQGAMP